jgi:cob(I)alamin adenosyltransferase
MNSKKDKYKKPRITISKVYTKAGDRGMTSLAGGQRLPKSHPRIEAYGSVDELNCFLGKALERARKTSDSNRIINALWRVQHELFNLGSVLATLPETIRPDQAGIEQVHIQTLEEEIDHFNENLPILKSFILPGGSGLAADLHICRAVCRRAERRIQSLSECEQIKDEWMIYLNRLSDWLFVLSRWVLFSAGLDEALWAPNTGR